jgi:hypothetical protein
MFDFYSTMKRVGHAAEGEKVANMFTTRTNGEDAPRSREQALVAQARQRLIRRREYERVERMRRRLAVSEEGRGGKEVFVRCHKCGEALERIVSST